MAIDEAGRDEGAARVQDLGVRVEALLLEAPLGEDVAHAAVLDEDGTIFHSSVAGQQTAVVYDYLGQGGNPPYFQARYGERLGTKITVFAQSGKYPAAIGPKKAGRAVRRSGASTRQARSQGDDSDNM